jgi:hypothetical protein
MKISKYLKSAVSGVKGFIVNKAMGALSGSASSLISNFGSTANQVASGNVSGVNELLKKSPFEKTLNSTSTSVKDDPLGFQHLQYPSELTGRELGNWILFFTIATNLGDNPAYNADLELAESMGLDPGKTWEGPDLPTDFSGPRNSHGPRGKWTDDIREQYKKRGITIPRMNKTNTVLSDDSTKDIVSGAIALYMPPDIKVSYGADWDAEDTNLSGDIAAAWKDVKNADLATLQTPEGQGEMMKKMFGHAGGAMAGGAAKVMSDMTQGAGMGDWLKLLGKGFGMAMNNRKEMFYTGPGWREFDYSFAFWPRNPDETATVQKIITMFKYHMHPWKDDQWGGRVFRYPSEFEIHYLHRTGVNTHLNKISRCALTSCNVKYTPGAGNFKTFDTDNAPITYKVDLHFKELEYLTKQKMKEGY